MKIPVKLRVIIHKSDGEEGQYIQDMLQREAGW